MGCPPRRRRRQGCKLSATRGNFRSFPPPLPPSPHCVSSSAPLSADSDRRVFTVSAVVARADAVLRERAALPIWVRGEVSGWTRVRSGHCFFCLKDESAELSCVLWADRAGTLPALPADGMEVDIRGRVGIYVRRGQFRMEVEQLEVTGGDGLWNLAKERLIQKLRSEGLLDEARKRPLPQFPERIGVVTSAGSAALQDMWRTMRRRAWWIRVVVSPTAVEGVDAGPDIAQAIRRFGSGHGQTPVDLVIVARGGGSRESLWAFNTEVVARALAASPIPTISAVGHETDYTVADYVADVRAATPTAGAEYASPDGTELLNRLAVMPEALRTRLERTLGEATEELEERAESLSRRMRRRHSRLLERLTAAERTVHARAPREHQRRMVERLATLEAGLGRAISRRVGEERGALDDREREIHRAASSRLRRLRLDLTRIAAETEARSPLRALARGYAVVTTPEGRIVRDPADAPLGAPLRIRLAGGNLRARSEGAEPETASDDA